MTEEIPQTNEETKEIPKQEVAKEEFVVDKTKKEVDDASPIRAGRDSVPKLGGHQIKSNEDSNIVFVGNKPFMKYVTSVVIQFTTKNKDKVIIKARGKFINKAVDIAEFTRKRFLEDKNLKIKDIKINSEGFKNKEGKDVNVSTIEITLSK